MAAALRNAAARLGGLRALQRTQAAIISEERRQVQTISEERRQVQTRLLHTRPSTIDEKKDVAIRLGKINEMKEEMYNLIAEFETKYKVPVRVAWPNQQLLEVLSVQVKPRSNDPHWRSCRNSRIRGRFMWLVGVCTSASIFANGFIWCLKEVEDPERKIIESMKKLVMDRWNKQDQWNQSKNGR